MASVLTDISFREDTGICGVCLEPGDYELKQCCRGKTHLLCIRKYVCSKVDLEEVLCFFCRAEMFGCDNLDQLVGGRMQAHLCLQYIQRNFVRFEFEMYAEIARYTIADLAGDYGLDPATLPPNYVPHRLMEYDEALFRVLDHYQDLMETGVPRHIVFVDNPTSPRASPERDLERDRHRSRRRGPRPTRAEEYNPLLDLYWVPPAPTDAVTYVVTRNFGRVQIKCMINGVKRIVRSFASVRQLPLAMRRRIRNFRWCTNLTL